MTVSPTTDALLRRLVRDALTDVVGEALQEVRAELPGTASTTVRTQADLDALVRRLLGATPDLREAISTGRHRIVLETGATLAPAAAVSRAAAPRTTPITTGAVTERMVEAAAKAGTDLVIGPRAVLTPLARNKARAKGVTIRREG